MRLVRTYTPPKSFDLGEEIANELLDLEPVQESGVWDGARLEWVAGGRIIQKLVVPPSDELLSLIHIAARKFGCLAISGYEAQAIGRPVVDGEVWYGKSPSVAETTVISRDSDGTDRLVAEIDTAPSKFMWLFAVMILFSFAWVLFLFIGGLREMGRQFWRAAVTGSKQNLTVTVTDSTVGVSHTYTSEADRAETVDRAGLLAFSHGTSDTGASQLIAIYGDRTVKLPCLVGNRDKIERPAQIDLVAQLNMLIGSY